MCEHPDTLAARVAAGDRRALARAITLVESTRADHRATARKLLETLGTPPRPALRVGLTGTPGVGKSSFIETLGLMLTGRGLRVAVLAVDPSSTRSGGSILGDKTRMERLARAPGAFIRPSPSQTALGGVARRTREAIRLVEAWGADVVLVETVGVGQSETMVAEMTDIFVLLIAPGGGDDLQGVKRGIMEMADLILVNKADGPHQSEAVRTCADYAGGLRLLRPRPGDPPDWPRALTVSALTGAGLEAAWSAVEALAAARTRSGALDARRRQQAEVVVRPRPGGRTDRAPRRRHARSRAAAGAGAARRRWRDHARRRRGRSARSLRHAQVRLRGETIGRFFKNDLHDEFGSWLFCYTATGGPDIGVLAAVGAAVGDGDDVAFNAAWMATGDRFAAEADSLLAAGGTDEARRLLLWAAACYATSYHPLYGAPVDPRLLASFRRQIATFDRALALLPHPVKPLRIPYEGTTLPAYLLPATGHEAEERPLVILTNGYDATVTEMYFAEAAAIAARGYHCLFFDGPGQGELLIEQGVPIRPDWEAVIRPVVDFALALPHIDPTRVALWGWSLGGYLALRGASGEPRLAACIADPGLRAVMTPQMLARFGVKVAGAAKPGTMIEAALEQAVKASPRMHWSLMQRGLWVHGVENLGRLRRGRHGDDPRWPRRHDPVPDASDHRGERPALARRRSPRVRARLPRDALPLHRRRRRGRSLRAGQPLARDAPDARLARRHPRGKARLTLDDPSGRVYQAPSRFPGTGPRPVLACQTQGTSR